jgi:tetratricopeptide (TPR) repeat protein
VESKFSYPQGDSPDLVLFYEGRRLMDANQLDRAITAFRQSAEMNPHYKTLQLLGDCLLRLGRAREAIIPLAAAVGLNRQYTAPMLLAQAFVAIGDLSKAEMAACKAVDIAPDNRKAKALLETILEARRVEFEPGKARRIEFEPGKGDESN